jgi:hypothetical protein
MFSVRETALQALLAALTSLAGVTVEREAVVPERVPPGGLVILRDGEPGEPEVTLSPLTYHYGHTAQLEVLVQVPGAGSARAVSLDGLLGRIGTVLASDRSLGGAVEWLEWAAPRTEDLALSAGAPIKGASVELFLTYSTPNPLL